MATEKRNLGRQVNPPLNAFTSAHDGPDKAHIFKLGCDVGATPRISDGTWRSFFNAALYASVTTGGARYDFSAGVALKPGSDALVITYANLEDFGNLKLERSWDHVTLSEYQFERESAEAAKKIETFFEKFLERSGLDPLAAAVAGPEHSLLVWCLLNEACLLGPVENFQEAWLEKIRAELT